MRVLSAGAAGCAVVHVTPRSVVRSKWTRHAFSGTADSVLLGASTEPSAIRTGLFLMGPRIPSGSRRASLHADPLPRDVRIIPHHSRRLAPTLSKRAIR